MLSMICACDDDTTKFAEAKKTCWVAKTLTQKSSWAKLKVTASICTVTGCYRSDYGLWWAYETHVVALSPEAYNYSLVIGCLWPFSSAQFEGTGFRMRSNVTCSPADARILDQMGQMRVVMRYWRFSSCFRADIE